MPAVGVQAPWFGTQLGLLSVVSLVGDCLCHILVEGVQLFCGVSEAFVSSFDTAPWVRLVEGLLRRRGQGLPGCLHAQLADQLTSGTRRLRLLVIPLAGHGACCYFPGGRG
ncbi:hypothetical protein M877_23900 [Streptomyces niveus NCIMB 11891]|nr:hypothetical protein M877_23900 [Streptomyces niveus NCIMB 11891]